MAVLAYIKQHIAKANAITYTFSSTSTGGANDIGALATDRRVIIGGFVYATTSATRSIDTITAGGVSTTTSVETKSTKSGGNVNSGAIRIAHALLTTATSISVVLTATTTVAGAAINVWSATECAATSATYGWTFASSTVGWLTATVATMGVNPISTGGFFVSQAVSLSLSTATWTNATMQHTTNFATEQAMHSGADGTASATVGIQMSLSNLFGAVWASFDSTTATAAASEEYWRRTTQFGRVAGRRGLGVQPYEWAPPAYAEHEARL